MTEQLTIYPPSPENPNATGKGVCLKKVQRASASGGSRKWQQEFLAEYEGYVKDESWNGGLVVRVG
ncbi:MAG: hypothetical protein CO042_03565 [Parcubacteria group bacterium CG_4_9_14_0_2_um_filter_41_8]|nr:MAG: hypothetical protein CO042_03565 [Parcubacteria group bacterium CG_4_9_14_0_2_um_filter_41_8]